MRIRGLGTAGASDLLAVLFPNDFGTVDQFVVRALERVPDLPRRSDIARTKPENLRVVDGIVLVEIMRDKARDLRCDVLD